MSKFVFVFISICVLCSCSGKKEVQQDNQYEIRNIYIETLNFPDSILSKFTERYINRVDTFSNYYESENKFIIYKFLDARELPTINLLNHTRKLNFRLYDETDSVGNPYYSFSLYESENSKWKRVYNFGQTSFYKDTLVDGDYILDMFTHWLNFRTWKLLP